MGINEARPSLPFMHRGGTNCTSLRMFDVSMLKDIDCFEEDFF